MEQEIKSIKRKIRSFYGRSYNATSAECRVFAETNAEKVFAIVGKNGGDPFSLNDVRYAFMEFMIRMEISQGK